MYGLPKIHKEGIPLRPTVSNIGAPTYQLSKHLSGLLSQLTGKSAHHVKNSFHFIEILKTLKIKPGDLMVSFDVVSLFTKVPVEESLTLLSQHFNKEILSLYKHVLTSTYFCVDGQFYEQTEWPWAPTLPGYRQPLHGRLRDESYRKSHKQAFLLV